MQAAGGTGDGGMRAVIATLASHVVCSCQRGCHGLGSLGAAAIFAPASQRAAWVGTQVCSNSGLLHLTPYFKANDNKKL